MKQFSSSTKSGFTLIEAMVAITILTIGVIGPLSLASRGISDGLFAQNQLTANMLAQEAIETIINQRNTNVLENPNLPPFRNILTDGPNPNYNGAGQPNVSVNGASGEVKRGDPNCQNSGPTSERGCFLSYDSDTNLYQEVNGEGQFRRHVALAENGDPAIDELKVDVTIAWKNKNVDKIFSVTEYIYGK